MLDPNKIDYESISAEFAWNMNLPLPRNYKLIHIGSHGVGVMSFLRQLYYCCNIFCRCSWAKSKINNPKNKYCTDFKDLLLNDKNTLIISFSEVFCDYEFKKYFSLVFYANIKILYQVRDPISVLKHTYARHYHWDIHKKLSHEFDLTFNWRCFIEPFEKFTQRIPKNISIKELYISSFLFDFFKEKINSNEIHYLDMNEIMPQKAFDTLQTLAQIFDFEKPNDKNKDIVEVKEFRGFLRYILPLTFYADPKDLKNTFSLDNTNHIKNLKPNQNAFKIILTRPDKNTDECLITDEFVKNDLSKDIGIYMKKDELDALKKEHLLYRAVKDYLNEFLTNLENANKLYEQNTLSNEKDMLEYLRKNHKESLKIKSILDKELSHIKTHRPDIVASWKYYAEFEKMCKKLEDKENECS